MIFISERTNPPPFVGTVTGLTYSPAMNYGITYYWQIRPSNTAGTASGCPVWSFTTVAPTNPNYVLTDDATSASPFDCVQLTAATNDQRGCAWDLNSTLDFSSDFSYDWTVNLGANDGGADGLTFVIQNDPSGVCACGTTGGSLGAGGISNSLIVEIDTYLNTQDRDDGMAGVLCAGGPNPDHLDLWLNGVVNPELGSSCVTDAGERIIPSAIPLTFGGADYNVENGLDHVMRISWVSATNTITVDLYDAGLSTIYGSLSYSFDPLTLFGTNSPFFGFTASTGGLSNVQSFCNPPSLLPVEMVGLNANCEDARGHLIWTTASEFNNDYFTIEKSVNGGEFQFMEMIKRG